MKYYIDCEFNGFMGQLMSIALVREDGQEFYEVLPFPEKIIDWVKYNVVPILYKEPVPESYAREKLQKFLNQDKAIHIVADHPADIMYFCQFIQVSNMGDYIRIPPMSFEVNRKAGMLANSLLPHNALEDAKAIRYADQH